MKLRRAKEPVGETNFRASEIPASTNGGPAGDDDATPLPELGDVGPLLTRHQVAELLNVSATSIWRLVGSGELPAYKVGGQIRIATADAEHYLKRTVPVYGDPDAES